MFDKNHDVSVIIFNMFLLSFNIMLKVDLT